MGNQKEQASLFDNYEVAKEGEEAETIISEIQEGTLGELKTENYFKEVENPEEVKKQKAIRIICENGAKRDFALPSGGNIISPRSSLGKFHRTYRNFPKVGVHVRTEVDKNGYPQIILRDKCVFNAHLQNFP